MKETIGLVTLTLSFIAYVPYIVDVLRKKAVPHPYSWLIWGSAATIMATLQLLYGGGALAWSTLAVGLISFGICVLSWRSGGKRFINHYDKLSLVVAIVAVVLWLGANKPTLAMLSLVAADLFGFIPSVRKTWVSPYSETLTMWGINALRHSLNILAISTYSLLTLADPVVWAIANLGFCIMVIARRKSVKSKKPRLKRF